MSTIKVSIIMPSLNVIDYIEECMESVINQTLKEIEIICIDAGSTDGTYEVLESYAKKDNRIRLITSKVKSYGYQMNQGLLLAKGDYIGIVETDDYIKPNMYEDLYSKAKENNVDIVKSDYCFFIDTEGKRDITIRELSKKTEMYNTIINAQENLDIFFMYGLNQPAIYKNTFIREHNILFNQTPGAAHQDNGFWFQCFVYAKNVLFLKDTYYMLRRDNPNSSIHNIDKNMHAMCEEYDFIRNFLRQDIELDKKYSTLCARFRYNNYNFTLSRLSNEAKLSFLYRYSQDFSVIERRNELDRNHYSDFEWDKLQSIIHDPVAYYEKTCKNGIKKSTNFIRRVIHFIKEQGLKNTIKKVLKKIGLKK